MHRFFIIILFCCIAQIITAQQNSFVGTLSDAALLLTKQKVVYDPAYYRMDYPNGDVPANRGVCTDVIIRAYRKLGVDLQKEVHEDMAANFHLYPKMWGLKRPDPNIDHRRVPNLQTFFRATVKVFPFRPMRPITAPATWLRGCLITGWLTSESW